MKEENALISIIVPVYNAENYLPLCIESLMAQTHTNIEIILVNDGSKDTSLRICKEYAKKDSRIRVIDKQNSGVSDTRNKGIDIAKGKYLMFCDSDDCAAPDWCKCLLEAQSDKMLTMCRYKTVDSAAMSFDLIQQDVSQIEGQLVEIDRKDFIFYRDKGFFFPVNKLFKKSIVDQFHIRFPVEISLGEDLAFALAYLIASGGDICMIPNVLYYYRTTGADSLSRKAPTVEQCCVFYQMITSAMIELGVERADAWCCRDNIVMQDFEKRLIKIADDNNSSFWKKYHMIKQSMHTEAYRDCCRNAVISPNQIYQWMLRNRNALLLLLYFQLRKRASI